MWCSNIRDTLPCAFYTDYLEKEQIFESTVCSVLMRLVLELGICTHKAIQRGFY